MQTTNVVDGLLIPMASRPWLLPKSVMVEVMPLRQPERPGRKGEDWLLGWLTWRNIPVPLVSIERFNETGQVSLSQHAKILILNSISTNGRFYAILIQGEPEDIKIDKDSLLDQQKSVLDKAEKKLVQIGDRLAVIPDLDMLEKGLSPLVAP